MLYLCTLPNTTYSGERRELSEFRESWEPALWVTLWAETQGETQITLGRTSALTPAGHKRKRATTSAGTARSPLGRWSLIRRQRNHGFGHFAVQYEARQRRIDRTRGDKERLVRAKGVRDIVESSICVSHRPCRIDPHPQGARFVICGSETVPILAGNLEITGCIIAKLRYKCKYCHVHHISQLILSRTCSQLYVCAGNSNSSCSNGLRLIQRPVAFGTLVLVSPCSWETQRSPSEIQFESWLASTASS